MLSRWGILAALCEAAHRQFVTQLGRTWGQEGHPKAEGRSVLPTWAPPETWHCHQLQRCQTGLEWAWELLMWEVLKACKHQLLPSEPTELGTREQTWINAVHGTASCQQRCCWCCNAQLTAISINLKRTLDIWLHLHHISHIPPTLGCWTFLWPPRRSSSCTSLPVEGVTIPTHLWLPPVSPGLLSKASSLVWTVCDQQWKTLGFILVKYVRPELYYLIWQLILWGDPVQCNNSYKIVSATWETERRNYTIWSLLLFLSFLTFASAKFCNILHKLISFQNDFLAEKAALKLQNGCHVISEWVKVS